MRYICRTVGVAAITMLGACASAPYVHAADKSNRGAVNFGQDPTDISAVTICYNESESTPTDIIKLAMDACGEFGKTARFEDQDYLTCPLVAPVAANYSCETP